MIIRVAPHQTTQGKIVYLSEQTVNYCTQNNITLSLCTASDSHNIKLGIIGLLRILPALNTLESRELGYVSPAPRILELRRSNKILTVRVDAFDRAGVLHRRIARYSLISEGVQAA